MKKQQNKKQKHNIVLFYELDINRIKNHHEGFQYYYLIIIQVIKVDIINMESPTKPIEDSVAGDQMLKTALVSQLPYRNLSHLILLVFCLCLSPFYYGYTLTYISTISSDILFQYFGPSAGQPVMVGFLIGVVPIGAGVGALSAPISMNFLSRKKFLLFFNAIAIIIAGIIQINNLTVLFVCRFFQGFIIGNYMGVAPVYIKQLTPVPIRGSVGAMSQFMNIGAVVFCYALGLIFQVTKVNGQFFWRFMFSFTGITVITQSVLLMFNVIPQSPSSLIQAGQLKKARKILAMFNSPDVLDNVFVEYIKLSRRNKFKITYRKKQNDGIRKTVSQHQIQLSARRASKPILFSVKDDIGLKKATSYAENILVEPSFVRNSSINKKQSSNDYTIDIETIFSKTQSKMEADKLNGIVQKDERVKISIKAFVLGFQLPLMQQFSGVKTIVTQIGVIMQQFDPQLALYTPLIANAIQFFATAGSILVLGKFGRRPILLAGNLGVAVCGILVGIFFLFLKINGDHNLIFGALTFILLFMVAYGLTIGPVVWLYVPEIIPPKIVPPATFMHWLGVSITVMATPIVIQACGSPYPVFLFFGAISMLFFIMNYFLVIQTKGLEPSQITEKLS